MRQRGFTLIEVLVAAAVAVLLASMTWPAYQGHLHRAGRAEAIEALQRLQVAQERHREMFGVYAADLAALGIAPATQRGSYQIALERSALETYAAQARTSAGGRQYGDSACPALMIEVRQGFATLGPDGKCWNR